MKKVMAFMEEAMIFFEKAAVISGVGDTAVAFAPGTVLMTFGAAMVVVSGGVAREVASRRESRSQDCW